MRRDFASTLPEVRQPLRKILVSKVDALKLVGLFGQWKQGEKGRQAAEKTFYRLRHLVTPEVRKFPGDLYALKDLERIAKTN